MDRGWSRTPTMWRGGEILLNALLWIYVVVTIIVLLLQVERKQDCILNSKKNHVVYWKGIGLYSTSFKEYTTITVHCGIGSLR